MVLSRYHQGTIKVPSGNLRTDSLLRTCQLGKVTAMTWHGMRRWTVKFLCVGCQIVVDVQRREARVGAGLAEQEQRGDYELSVPRAEE